MNKKMKFAAITVTAMFILFGAGTSFAQTTVTTVTTATTVPSETSVDLATTTASVEAVATTDYTTLMLTLSADFGIDVTTLDSLVADGYKPGQIWLALEISKNSPATTGTALTLEQALALTAGSEGHGWGVLAAKLGIDPGSKEFLSLKERVETHTRTMLSGVVEEHGKRVSETVRTEGGSTAGSVSGSGSAIGGAVGKPDSAGVGKPDSAGKDSGLGTMSHAGLGSGGKH